MRHTLRQLEASFIKRSPTGSRAWLKTKSIHQADGLQFLCPVCVEKNGGKSRGAHLLVLWFTGRDVPDDVAGGSARWTVSKQSTGLDDLTFVHGFPVKAKSVGVGEKNEHAHFFIEGGEVVNTSRDLHEPEVHQ